MFRSGMYLVTVLLAGSSLAFTQTPVAKVIHEFDGADKASPSSNLVQLTDGDFVGMVGAPINESSNAGRIYLLKSDGSVETLYQFAADGSQCASGAPNLTSTPGALTQASDGDFYGVCAAGGQFGMGSIFRFTASGRFTVLHSFNGSDGSHPAGALLEGLDGNLYGVTLNGGLDAEFGGTIFRLRKGGDFTTLWLFNAAAENGASNPTAGLALGPDGNIYGMFQLYQEFYGAFPGPGGIFQIDYMGNVTFPGFFQSAPWACAPVISPKGTIFALQQASNFVGDNNQTFEDIPSGSTFANVVMNLPPYFDKEYVNFFGCMILGTDGLFYANGISAIAKPTHPFVELQLDPAAQQTHFFDLGPYGEEPVLSPLEASDGKLYIVNNGGGKYGLGNILTLDYGLKPPAPRIAAFRPASGSAGTNVTIGGALYVGVTSVTLNGLAVSFRNKGSSFIDFAVPPGATSGVITVTTAAGTATSADPFTVE
jgi:uncharacterized repeat protein (TIGR03803 family)